ncbi:YidD family protein [Thiovulum sp. ES]|nr:YidD family protein [Thiovulum sp. ES]
MKKIIQIFINFYQKYLTLLAYGSCRYYPTCSQYTKEQFRFNSFFKALFFSSKRIVTCNQLFIGGIDYPIIQKDFLTCVSFQKIGKIEYWFVPVPKKEKHFFAVKVMQHWS